MYRMERSKQIPYFYRNLSGSWMLFLAIATVSNAALMIWSGVEASSATGKTQLVSIYQRYNTTSNTTYAYLADFGYPVSPLWFLFASLLGGLLHNFMLFAIHRTNVTVRVGYEPNEADDEIEYTFVYRNTGSSNWFLMLKLLFLIWERVFFQSILMWVAGIRNKDTYLVASVVVIYFNAMKIPSHTLYMAIGTYVIALDWWIIMDTLLNNRPIHGGRTALVCIVLVGMTIIVVVSNVTLYYKHFDIRRLRQLLNGYPLYVARKKAGTDVKEQEDFEKSLGTDLTPDIKKKLLAREKKEDRMIEKSLDKYLGERERLSSMSKLIRQAQNAKGVEVDQEQIDKIWTETNTVIGNLMDVFELKIANQMQSMYIFDIMTSVIVAGLNLGLFIWLITRKNSLL